MSNDKINLFTKAKNFFVDCKKEFKKIVWPTQKTVLKNTGIVLAMIFVMGIFVAALDAGFLQALSTIMSVSSNK